MTQNNNNNIYLKVRYHKEWVIFKCPNFMLLIFNGLHLPPEKPY